MCLPLARQNDIELVANGVLEHCIQCLGRSNVSDVAKIMFSSIEKLLTMVISCKYTKDKAT